MPISTLAKSLVPAARGSDWKKLAAEADKAQATLKKDKANAEAKKTLKAYTDEVDKLESQFGKAVDALQAKLTELDGALDEIAKLKPMPDAIAKPLEKYRKILASSRAPEISDLRKEQKRAALHSNPSKVERLIGELNDDVQAVNTLADAVDKATDDMFALEIVAMRKEIVAALQSPLTPASIVLDTHLKTFTTTNQQKRWKGFEAARKAFVDKRLAEAAEALRRVQVSALGRDKEFAALNAKKRSSITEAADKSGDAVDKVRADLQAALAAQLKLEAATAAAAVEAQWTLKQKVWAERLGMEGYGIVQKGKFEGDKIHITYDNNSWTAGAYKGVSVQLGDGSADQIFDALFKVDWTYQFHATLELPNASGDNAHIYAFGEKNQKRWQQVADDNQKDKAWITKAQKAVGDVLDTYIKDVKKKIQKVIDDAPKK
jgi:hypothetical protein